MITPGTPAPELTLSTGRGPVRLADYRGHKTVVLYFYPKDFTLGCTVEACTFRDSYEDFTALGAEVIGVSADGADSHDGFARKHRLPFILASDADGSAARAFGVDASLFGLIRGRVTFVIDKLSLIHISEPTRLL